MAEPAKYFNNIILGQYILSGIPIDVFVDGGYLRLTDTDDVEDPLYGFGMDTDGGMYGFDYRMIDHILVNGNNITLDTYNKATGATEEKPAEEKPEEKEGEEETKKEESVMKLKSLVEKALTQQRKKIKEDVTGDKKKLQNMKKDIATRKQTAAKLAAKIADQEAEEAKMDLGEGSDPVTSVSEPYTIQIGDLVQNVNTACPHYGSMGIVQNVMALPNDMGTVVKYTVTNDGDTYSAGDSLIKTVDQLALAHDGEEIDFNDYSDDLDDYDVVDYDFGDDDDDDDWKDGEDYEYYDDEEDEEEEEYELEEASNPSFKDRQLIDKFAKWVGKGKTPTSSDIDYYSQLKKLTPEEKYLLKKTFLPDIKIKSTGTTPDIRYRFI